jgi:hypothetical protein
MSAVCQNMEHFAPRGQVKNSKSLLSEEIIPSSSNGLGPDYFSVIIR